MMKEIIKPSALEPGDAIGIISPSEPMYFDQGSDLISQGIKTLETDGFKVVFAPNASKSSNYMAGSRYERASDINLLFSMPEIKALICSRGGKSSNQLLDLLDYNLIQNNPKIILGFSDSTTILNAIQMKTGLVTFYGPQNLTHFRNVGRTLDFFHRATVYGNIGEIGSYAGEVIKPGQATGRIVGGNLSCFSLGILGTEYQPDFQNKILFWAVPIWIWAVSSHGIPKSL
jgi:muramoyltetrapeptide carboxypeptidase